MSFKGTDFQFDNARFEMAEFEIAGFYCTYICVSLKDRMQKNSNSEKHFVALLNLRFDYISVRTGAAGLVMRRIFISVWSSFQCHLTLIVFNYQ